jgi:hypothetical protein
LPGRPHVLLDAGDSRLAAIVVRHNHPRRHGPRDTPRLSRRSRLFGPWYSRTNIRACNLKWQSLPFASARQHKRRECSLASWPRSWS